MNATSRWQRLSEDLEAAAAASPEERERLLAARRAEDPSFAAELERLLAADAAAGPLDAGATELLGSALDAGAAEELDDTREQPPVGGDPRPSATAPPGAPLPTRIGRYAVLERIGSGGFGEVFRGLDPALKRAVAIKTCPSPDPEARRRFVREAELAARLLHPNIVTIHDFGVDGEVPFLIQELLPGEDLAPWLARSPAFAERWRALLDVARGLAHAHAAGVVHRDIKPGNLRVLPGGQVKILDFGIARELGAVSALTGEERAVGTLAYMAPEQARGGEPDARVDVYAFGAVAFEVFGGARALPGDSPSFLYHRLLHGTPRPLREVAPSCPPQLCAVVDRCLAREPDDRYRDARDLLAALEPLAQRLDQQGEGMRRAAGARRVGPWIAAALALALATGIVLVAPRLVGRSAGAARVVSAATSPDAARGEPAIEPAAPATLPPAPILPAAATSAPPSTTISTDGAPPATAATEATAAPAPAAAALPPTTGWLQVEARPWGELIRLRDAAAGTELPLPGDRSTPLALALPAGEYTAWVRDPTSGRELSCTARLSPEGQAPCIVTLRRLRAEDLLEGTP